MQRVLVSACLLGRACRFDGKDKLVEGLADSLRAEAVPFCPEEAGGLGTPRPAARIVGGDGEDVADGRARVVNDRGEDVTGRFLDGARRAVEEALRNGCAVAYLKERSPSCGCAQVHTAEGVARGCGVTAALLRRAGVATVSVA
ncbi:MAG: DUF523 domain-containing protein [Planctomycetes bacterium]|nr:DUF523 domain-containing protein [Planctomycetota bacterium]